MVGVTVVIVVIGVQSTLKAVNTICGSIFVQEIHYVRIARVNFSLIQREILWKMFTISKVDCSRLLCRLSWTSHRRSGVGEDRSTRQSIICTRNGKKSCMKSMGKKSAIKMQWIKKRKLWRTGKQLSLTHDYDGVKGVVFQWLPPRMEGGFRVWVLEDVLGYRRSEVERHFWSFQALWIELNTYVSHRDQI